LAFMGAPGGGGGGANGRTAAQVLVDEDRPPRLTGVVRARRGGSWGVAFGILGRLGGVGPSAAATGVVGARRAAGAPHGAARMPRPQDEGGGGLVHDLGVFAFIGAPSGGGGGANGRTVARVLVDEDRPPRLTGVVRARRGGSWGVAFGILGSLGGVGPSAAATGVVGARRAAGARHLGG
jgi:hypothetical protein